MDRRKARIDEERLRQQNVLSHKAEIEVFKSTFGFRKHANPRGNLPFFERH